MATYFKRAWYRGLTPADNIGGGDAMSVQHPNISFVSSIEIRHSLFHDFNLLIAHPPTNDNSQELSRLKFSSRSSLPIVHSKLLFVED